MSFDGKIGVLLLNLGGPEREEEVASFLFNLFSDRDIIRLGPRLLQKPLARLIAGRRAPKSRAAYRKIGGGSPILKITTAQARALEQALGKNFLVRVCMRYWHPFATEVLTEVAGRIDRLILLPLYPHYSKATTGSSVSDLHRARQQINLDIPVQTISSWPDHAGYINCLVDRINRGRTSFDGAPVEIVYSAHSLPKQFVKEGDPYVREIQQTIQALEAKTGIHGHLCYQSRSGPVEWLKPSTPDMLVTLAEKGRRNILMVPISFVSDHIETLYEINMLYRQQAKKLGMRLRSTPGLNDDPDFIAVLTDLVQKMI